MSKWCSIPGIGSETFLCIFFGSILDKVVQDISWAIVPKCFLLYQLILPYACQYVLIPGLDTRGSAACSVWSGPWNGAVQSICLSGNPELFQTV